MKTALASQGSDLTYFDVPSFLDNDKASVFHGFFGRRGGDSKGIYSSLNCGIGTDDNPGLVKGNRQAIASVAGVPGDNMISLHQIHSDLCLRVDKPWGLGERPEADAFVTDVPGIGLGILTADCAPVLFYGESEGKPVIGAAHAGWGGALKGILESTVSAMNELGVQTSDIRTAIGPCIGKASYEVEEAFSAPFLDEDPEQERFFQSARKEGHLMFDLAGYCANKLFKAGVTRVYIKDLDTYFNEEDFFSYRRSIHRHEKDYGRQLSVICIKN